ncbi:MAG TPA: hypothetical protein PK624_00610 [Spirochaetota bacterium]|nr:hypothetical protein [Spirochaetota bacterium]HOF32531.1 hypothetical protein [Spirochaetota bacterium]HOR43280.1 hypothetical protein [Spirochaetota bacterium]HOU84147.1 hypothetical protein [Spirochaetota bacterium]HPK54971.1 hypothetical protein [Spirochaetota bacterium]
MITQRQLPPVSLKSKIRGIIFIILIIGLSILASHIFVPKMIAFTVMNDRLSAITPDNFIIIKNKLILLPDFIERHNIDKAEALKSIEGLTSSKVKTAAEKAFPEKDDSEKFIKTFLNSAELSPFCKETVYEEASHEISREDMKTIISIYNTYKNSLIMYLPALKIIIKDINKY